MKICIVGYGSIGKRHHRVLSEIFRNTAEFKIVDINTEVKIDDVVEEQFNILVICTPSSSHLEIASKFKNISDLIFIEKPLDTSIKKLLNTGLRLILKKYMSAVILDLLKLVRTSRKYQKIVELLMLFL